MEMAMQHAPHPALHVMAKKNRAALEDERDPEPQGTTRDYSSGIPTSPPLPAMRTEPVALSSSRPVTSPTTLA